MTTDLVWLSSYTQDAEIVINSFLKIEFFPTKSFEIFYSEGHFAKFDRVRNFNLQGHIRLVVDVMHNAYGYYGYFGFCIFPVV